MISTAPSVSVKMLTYNHGAFIKDAIMGVLNQKVNFPVELVIADDASRDNTEDVINEIISGYKGDKIIHYFRHPKNLGVNMNGPFALQQCKNKYVALCEGDDYWTDPGKLQKQVDFLEQNPDVVVYGTNATMETVGMANEKKVHHQGQSDVYYELTDFIENNRLVTCTAVFRNTNFDPWYKIVRKASAGDWLLWVFLLQKFQARAYSSHEVTANYRVHPGGIFSRLDQKGIFQFYIDNLYWVSRLITKNDTRAIANKKRTWYGTQLFRSYLRDHEWFKALKQVVVLRFMGMSMKQTVQLLAEWKNGNWRTEPG